MINGSSWLYLSILSIRAVSISHSQYTHKSQLSVFVSFCVSHIDSRCLFTWLAFISGVLATMTQAEAYICFYIGSSTLGHFVGQGSHGDNLVDETSHNERKRYVKENKDTYARFPTEWSQLSDPSQNLVDQKIWPVNSRIARSKNPCFKILFGGTSLCINK